MSSTSGVIRADSSSTLPSAVSRVPRCQRALDVLEQRVERRPDLAHLGLLVGEVVGHPLGEVDLALGERQRGDRVSGGGHLAQRPAWWRMLKPAGPAASPAEAPAASPVRRFRDRVLGLRAVVRVGAAGVILGGLGGFGIHAAIDGDDRDGRMGLQQPQGS